MKIFYAAIGVLLLYYLQRYLYQRYWCRKLQVDISLSRNHAVEGEELLLTETVLNQKLLPIPILKVKFMTSRHLLFADMSNSSITDHYYRNDMLSAMMYQKITREISFRCSHRGYFTMDKIYLISSDLLFSREYVSEADINVRLYVYPGPVDSSRLQIPFQKMLGTVLTKRFINEDPFEFKGIREYQVFDTLKTINWKASAKAGSLMVNVFDYTSSQQIRIFLNLDQAALRKQEDVLEESIRIAAALSEGFISRGVPTALDTNGTDLLTHGPASIPAGSGASHIRTMKEALARIDADADPVSFSQILKKELPGLSQKDFLVLISSYHKEDLQQLLFSLLRDKIDFFWMLPYNSDLTPHIPDELKPYVHLWEVVS